MLLHIDGQKLDHWEYPLLVQQECLFIAYMQNGFLKMIQMNLFTKQKQLTDLENQTYAYK